jgi:hypothetical protein
MLDRKGPRRKSRIRWDNNIKMHLREIIGRGGCGLDSSGSEQGPMVALVNTVMNMQVA